MSDCNADTLRPMPAAIEGLDMHVHLGPGDQVAEALVVLLVVNPQRPAPVMALHTSAGLNWVSARGLIEEARDTFIGAPSYEAGTE